MSHMRCIFYLILIPSVITTPQLNLYDTDWINSIESNTNNTLEHNCLRLIYNDILFVFGGFIAYCMSELPSKFKLENYDYISELTFDELAKENITCEQLFLWSAPIDLIEKYQFYLNQLSTTTTTTTTNDLSLGTEVFYNCTPTRFGPKCQYQLDYQQSHHLSVLEIIRDYYQMPTYNQNSLTCYIHLQCIQHLDPPCLDWTDICDGKIDCLNDGIDEEHCWELEINQCNDNEYRCRNGQCIPSSFKSDLSNQHDCIDASDILNGAGVPSESICSPNKPSFACDDTKCNNTIHITSSCIPDRESLLRQRMFSIESNLKFEQCWSALKCLFNIQDVLYAFCDNNCMNDECKNIILNTCPSMLYFPNVPVFFDDIYFVFKKNDLQDATIDNIGLLYICYNNSRYDDFFNMTSKISFDNRACFLHETISYQPRWSGLWNAIYERSLRQLNDDLRKYRLIFDYTSIMCNRSNMYQCINSSKCISIYRLMDNYYDCPYMDDEMMFAMNNTNIIKQLKHSHYKCELSDKYIHIFMINNGPCDCGYLESSEWCEDENVNDFDLSKQISFQTTCDGYVELYPKSINGRNETDETECEQWEYEIGCNSLPLLNCSSNHHICVSPYTNKLICLPIDKANDGKIDCLGAIDEPLLCRKQKAYETDQNRYHCANQSSEPCINTEQLCDDIVDCEQQDDEKFCTKDLTDPFSSLSHCQSGSMLGSDVGKFWCNQMRLPRKVRNKPFILTKPDQLIKYAANNMNNGLALSSSLIQISNQLHFRCHRGLDLTVWLNNVNKSTTYTCLCPPSYYGDQCQYQNQRISLILEFRTYSDSRSTPFAIVVSLIDTSDHRIVHSYQQFSYLSIRHCNLDLKHYMYLLYSTRPKDKTKDYAIHIDFYEKQINTLSYRGGTLYPITFPFLPIHRLALLIDIPRNDDRAFTCSDKMCHHGNCTKYANNPKSPTFCRCNQGWSGKYCTIPYTCTCANGSLCIGITVNNQSICVCPLNKFGPRCLLSDTTCENENNSICDNGGQCIFNPEYRKPEEKFTCICPAGFHRERCQESDYKLELTFNKAIILTQSIKIHFLRFVARLPMIRITTFQTIRFQQNSTLIQLSQPFHLVFIELTDSTFYLALVRDQSLDLPKMANNTISAFDRCPNITELFNKTFLQWDLIRRIKYYHLPCGNQLLNLSCFHDEAHLCLCQNFSQKRVANCLKFDHKMKFDCDGQNECENGAQCFQDNIKCPEKSSCLCPPCYYGRRCQFTTSGFGLALDAIIGYHILPNITLTHQSAIVQFSFAVTIIFMVAGLIDGILCIITFKNKPVQEIGCGLYLLASSIATICIMIMFALKFFILLYAQIGLISDILFLQIQCIIFDFILRVCLITDQWLSACVATERAITIIKATRFDKKKSKRIAKYVIVILLIIIIGSSIHDPIHRRLIDEVDDMKDKRIWCIISYTKGLRTYNSIIHTLHFFGPFILNLVTSIILVMKKSRHQVNMRKNQAYKTVLREQILEHKNILIAPVALVILGLPRLIITYVSKCMQAPSDAWLFLIGYLISFVPCILTFVIFILPSEFYKEELHKTIVRYRNNVQRRLNLMS